MVSNRLYLAPFPIPSQQTQLAPSITTATNHYTTPFFAVDLSSHLLQVCLDMVTSLLPPTLCNSKGPPASASAWVIHKSHVVVLNGRVCSRRFSYYFPSAKANFNVLIKYSYSHRPT
jgi:hypothetical protein